MSIPKRLIKIIPKGLIIKFIKRSQFVKENVIYGGTGRERILVKLLKKYYKSTLYRDWNLKEEQPHFYNQQAGIFITLFGNEDKGIDSIYRGFYSAEVIGDGDILLDIGCGDGFFTKRFFSSRCRHIDAIDIEKSAIHAAQSYNAHEKIKYYLLDAVKSPFPRDDYDVIVWDGALGHFGKDTTHLMLKNCK